MSELSPNTLSRHARRLSGEMRRLIEVRGLQRWNAESLLLGGSFFRGSLLMELAESFGVDSESALTAGVAVELIHNASLVHDDIMDQDMERRGKPSALSVLGSSQALLFGDVLIAESYACIAGLEVPSQMKVRLIQTLSQVILNASRGQSAQLDCKAGMSCTLDACIEWSRLKTGMLFALPVEFALILADQEYAGKLAVAVAIELGLSYQILDDLFDFIGRKRGRKVASDTLNADWTFARVARRDFPGMEIPTMIAWIQACFDRIDAIKILLPATVRFVFAEVARGMREQIDRIALAHGSTGGL